MYVYVCVYIYIERERDTYTHIYIYIYTCILAYEVLSLVSGSRPTRILTSAVSNDNIDDN